MKKYIYTLLFFLFGAFSMHAQDTIMVPAEYEGSAYGALNKFILGDTTSTGERAHPWRVYKLERNKIYFLNGTLLTDFDLNLYADPADENNKPPIITSGIGQDGSIVAQHIKCKSNASFKNVYFMVTPPTNLGAGVITVDLLGAGMNYEFDNVVFEWGNWETIKCEVANVNVTIKNCYFRNIENPNSPWNGRGLDFRDNDAGQVIMTNNTFFNMNSFVLQGENCVMDFVQFEHNTIVNTIKWPFQWQWQTHAVIKNNIFHNVHSYGEDSKDKEGQDVDGQQFGIFNLELLPADVITKTGVAEGDRIVNFNNNNYFFSQEVIDYLSDEVLSVEPLFNNRTQGFFDDDTTYPNITNDNTYNMNPGFVNAGDVNKMVQWMSDLRDGKGTTYWGYDPDDNRFEVTWPLPEDLSYTNETLLTGGDDGLPLGDLNWFPEHKATWDAALVGTEEKVLSSIGMNSSFPNPFSTAISMDYTIDHAMNVQISVYDLSGRLIQNLKNEKQDKGNHIVTWKPNASVHNGIYVIRFNAEGFLSTEKIVFQR